MVLVPALWQADHRRVRGNLTTQNANTRWRAVVQSLPVMLLGIPVPHAAEGPLPFTEEGTSLPTLFFLQVLAFK